MQITTYSRAETRAAGGTRGITRRTLARGTAWAAPVVVVGIAAPAFAASGAGCLNAEWTEAVYSGANSNWSFCLKFWSCGDEAMTVTSIEVRTGYHAPATFIPVSPQVVLTLSPNLVVAANKTAANPVVFCSQKQPFTPAPGAKGTVVPDYYNDFESVLGAGDGAIPCVAKDQGDPPVFPSNGLYPESCQRLQADGTSLVVTYTSLSGGGSVTLPMNDQVGCRVTAGCDKP